MPRRKRPRHGNEKVRKDTLDLRDIYYEPTLEELPIGVDNWARVPTVRNQLAEGACVGFAAAAVVDYLLANRKKRSGFPRGPTSPRMLYEIAKRYDEWEGTDYEGTSLRGAMKGWFHHGVCAEAHWPYEIAEGEQGSLTAEAALDAQRRPLGAYYRVHHRRLNHMHAALHEAGILLASCAVHAGWDGPDADGAIPYERKTDGGHAFAIFGYDEAGFWIQNSWGPGWGVDGYGHLSYEDWLENGWDCWVARLGVPVQAFGHANLKVSERARFDFVPHAEADPAAIAPHLVHLGDDGKLHRTGRFPTDAAHVTELVTKHLPETTAGWDKTRLLLYAHGGLNDANASAARIASLRDHFLANRIYPVHFMWETGLLASLVGAVRHAFTRERAAGVGERFTDLIDEALELGARPLGRPIWREMKRNAAGASTDTGGAALLVDQLRRWRDAGNAFELHLVGHSAGSVFHAHLVERLVAAGIPIHSLTLFAPACTTQLFETKVLSQLGQIRRLAIFNLNDRAERDDSVGPYRKSLLYLVSEAFEDARHQPLLGLERTLPSRGTLRSRLGAGFDTGRTSRGYLLGGPKPAGFASNAMGHSDFDEDAATLNATLRIVLGAAPQQSF